MVRRMIRAHSVAWAERVFERAAVRTRRPEETLPWAPNVLCGSTPDRAQLSAAAGPRRAELGSTVALCITSIEIVFCG